MYSAQLLKPVIDNNFTKPNSLKATIKQGNVWLFTFIGGHIAAGCTSGHSRKTRKGPLKYIRTIASSIDCFKTGLFALLPRGKLNTKLRLTYHIPHQKIAWKSKLIDPDRTSENKEQWAALEATVSAMNGITLLTPGVFPFLHSWTMTNLAFKNKHPETLTLMKPKNQQPTCLS